jgi:hypothetical protein
MGSDRRSPCDCRASAAPIQALEIAEDYFRLRHALGGGCRAGGKICRAFTGG